MNRPTPATPNSILKAARLIQKGGLVAFPTETVYGLGADAFNPDACARIFEVKRRPFFDPLIVHIAKLGDLKRLTPSVDERIQRIASRFWPGPLTLVLPKHPSVPAIVSAGLSTVAVRLPQHPTARALIHETQTAIAAPSANPFGYISPTKAEHVWQQLGQEVDLILDGGACSIGVESTIIDLTSETPTLLRPGGISAEDIEKIMGPIAFGRGLPSSPAAPGQLPSHYAPHTPVRIQTPGAHPKPDKKTGYLAFCRAPDNARAFQAVKILSPSGDLKEAAFRLFDLMHELDAMALDLIIVEAVPESGLGRAIMDRLKKAAAKTNKPL